MSEETSSSLTEKLPTKNSIVGIYQKILCPMDASNNIDSSEAVCCRVQGSKEISLFPTKILADTFEGNHSSGGAGL